MSTIEREPPGDCLKAEKAIVRCPSDVKGYMDAARAYLEAGLAAEARECLEDAFELAPGLPEIKNLLVQLKSGLFEHGE